MSTRVLLVDDHQLVRSIFRDFLETYPDVTVVGEAEDGTNILEQVEELSPSVVLMDVNMPRVNGLEATKILELRYPELPVIGLTVYMTTDEDRRAMIAAGATGLVYKDAGVEEVYRNIQAALRVAQTAPVHLPWKPS